MRRLTDHLHEELESALMRVPKDGYILTSREMARIIVAVGGSANLNAILSGDMEHCEPEIAS